MHLSRGWIPSGALSLAADGDVGARGAEDIKVRGRWCYLYRAIDRNGAVVDVMLNKRRDLTAARAFSQSAKSVAGKILNRVTSDGHHAYPQAIRTELGKTVTHRTERT